MNGNILKDNLNNELNSLFNNNKEVSEYNDFYTYELDKVYKIYKNGKIEIARLPKEYQEVEYIESTGTQYIDTGISGTRYIKVSLDMQFTEYSSNSMVMVAWSTGAGRWFGKGGLNTYSAGNGAVSEIDALLRKQAEVTFTNSGISFTIDDGTYSKTATTSQSISYTLFAGRNVNTGISYYSKAKLYKATIQENETTIMDLVPCYRKSDKVAGLYDTVSDAFYTNAGTGEFNVGADIITLPADYQRVEYIKSTRTQYINTKFVPNQDTTVEAVATFNTNVTGFLYGSRVDQMEDTFSLPYVSARRSIRSDYDDTQGDYYPATLGTKYTMKQQKNKFYLDGVYKEEKPYSNFTTPGSMLIFAVNTNHGIGSYVAANLYSLRVWDGDRIDRDFIPCYRKIDNVPGLYDIVNDVFYTNAGSGEFTVGPEINTL